jgi:hypothetical protein
MIAFELDPPPDPTADAAPSSSGEPKETGAPDEEREDRPESVTWIWDDDTQAWVLEQ